MRLFNYNNIMLFIIPIKYIFNTQVLGILKDQQGNFKRDGPMTEIRWIAMHPYGFYRMNDKERTDYKLKTKKKYSRCTVLHPPNFENSNE